MIDRRWALWFLVIHLGSLFLTSSPISQAFGAGDEAAPLSKKEKDLDIAYGTQLFSAPTTEDEEVDRITAQMRKKGKSAQKISEKIEKIRLKYRQIAKDEIEKKKTIQEQEANSVYRTTLSTQLTELQSKKDLNSIIKRTLLQQLEQAKGRGNGMDQLQNIQQSVLNNFSHLSPLYSQLAEEKGKLERCMDEAKNIHIDQITEFELLEYSQRLGEILSGVETVIRRVNESRNEISFTRGHNASYRNEDQSEILTDIEGSNLQIDSLFKKITHQNNFVTEELANRYREIYKQLKNKIRVESKNKEISPLRKHLARSLFKTIQSQIQGVHPFISVSHPFILLRDFDQYVNHWAGVCDSLYADLEEEIQSYLENRRSHEHLPLTDELMRQKSARLQQQFQSAQSCRSRFQKAGSPGSKRYHGDFKKTESEVRKILWNELKESFPSAKTVAKTAGKAAGIIVGVPLALPAAAVAGAVAIPVGLMYGVGKGAVWLGRQAVGLGAGLGARMKNFAALTSSNRKKSKRLRAENKQIVLNHIKQKKAYRDRYLQLKAELQKELLASSTLERHLAKQLFSGIPKEGFNDYNDYYFSQFRNKLQYCMKVSSERYLRLEDEVRRVAPTSRGDQTELDAEQILFSLVGLNSNYQINLALLLEQAIQSRNCENVLKNQKNTQGLNYIAPDGRKQDWQQSHLKDSDLEGQNFFSKDYKTLEKQSRQILALYDEKIGRQSLRYRMYDSWAERFRRVKESYLEYSEKLDVQADLKMTQKLAIQLSQLSEIQPQDREDHGDLERLDHLKRNISNYYRIKLKKKYPEKEENLLEDESNRMMNLFMEETAEIQIRLRQLASEINENDQDEFKYKKMSAGISKKLLVEEIASSFSVIFEGKKLVPGFNEIARLVHIQVERAKELDDFEMELNRVREEIQRVKESGPLSPKDRIYLRALKMHLRRYSRGEHLGIAIFKNYQHILGLSKSIADQEYESFEKHQKERETADKAAYWRTEDERKKKSNRRFANLDTELTEAVAKTQDRFQVQVDRFLDLYPAPQAKTIASTSSMTSSAISSAILKQATLDLEQGKVKPPASYCISADEMETRRVIEAQAAYCSFLKEREHKNHSPKVSEGSDASDSKGTVAETSERVVLDPKKARETFIANYVCLPEQVVFKDDNVSKCLICLEPVEYDFKPLSEISDISLEHDDIVQVPVGKNAHKISICGHLIHKECIQGHQVNRGLATYKCPKCRSLLPFHEFDSNEWIEKYGFCWGESSEEEAQNVH